MARQEVPPQDSTAYSDIFWASLYGTLCGFGFAGLRLIWMRSSAFLVAHAAFIGLIGRGSLDNNPPLLAVLAGAGILLAGLWMAVNSLGWMNQNLWFWHAARLKFTKVQVRLPTDFCDGEEVPKPFGAIFAVAQLVCLVFIVAYAAVLVSAMVLLGSGIVCAVLLSTVAVLVVIGAAYIAHRKFYQSVKKVAALPL